MSLHRVLALQEQLVSTPSVIETLKRALGELANIELTLGDLEESKVGIDVSALRKHADAEVSSAAKELLKKWKNLVKTAVKTMDEKPESQNDGDLKRKLEQDDGDDSPKKKAKVEDTEDDESRSPGKQSDDGEDNNVGGPLKAPSFFKDSDFVTDNKIRNTVRQRFYDNLGEDYFPNVLDRKYCAYAIETGLMDFFQEVNQGYKEKVREITFNLRDKTNVSFNAKLADGTMDPYMVASLSGMDMWSEENRKALEAKIKYDQEARRSDWAKEQAMKNAKEGMFWCGRCKKNKTTYYQLQTRGADEPMTTFVSCLNCGKRWRF